jgi:phage terminase small subunit
MALSEKHELFVMAYLKNLNATEAAIEAGYSEKSARVQGSRLLTNADIRARIDELLERRKEKMELDADFVIGRLLEISEMCMRAKPVMKWDYEERQLVETGEYTFDSSGANKAMELIGKHMGMFKEKIEHSGGVTHEHKHDLRKLDPKELAQLENILSKTADTG